MSREGWERRYSRGKPRNPRKRTSPGQFEARKIAAANRAATLDPAFVKQLAYQREGMRLRRASRRGQRKW